MKPPLIIIIILIILVCIFGVVAVIEGYKGITRGNMYLGLKDRFRYDISGKMARVWGIIYLLIGGFILSIVMFAFMSLL